MTDSLFDENSQTRLIEALETSTLDPAAFHHREHVQLTWALLRRMPCDAALSTIRDGLKRLVASVGMEDKYHETMTVFYTRLIHDRMRSMEGASWQAFAERNADLLEAPRDLLHQHYREETIQSDAARLGYLPPDIVN